LIGERKRTRLNLLIEIRPDANVKGSQILFSVKKKQSNHWFVLNVNVLLKSLMRKAGK
jgi:hypothetical protein